jgi:FkbM family methyltransferase
MTDDELTILMIAAQGETLAPIGRWKEPLLGLAEQGLMERLDDHNYRITRKGEAAVRVEEQERDGAFRKVLAARQPQMNILRVDMTVLGRQIIFELLYDSGFIADIQTRQFLEHNGACEPEVVHLLRRVLRPGDLALDGGANIGFFTLVMSRLVGPTGHVETFEPSVVNFKKLRANLEHNRIDNVTAINRALWSEDVEVTLHTPPDTGECSLMPVPGELSHISVGGLTLDKWCMEYGQQPRLLKLDIEGAELHALIGAGQLLTKGIDFVVCELNLIALDRFGASQMDLRDYMASKGYSTFELQGNGDRPVLVARERVLVPETANANILFSTSEKVQAAWGEALP